MNQKFLFKRLVVIASLNSCLSLIGASLINKDYVANFLTKEACWADSHCARNDFLGTGMLYYCLTYMKKAKFCVCLGSGGGFVPRVIKQAQRDLGIESARTILVDANIGDYGRPQWLEQNSFFKQNFSDIEILLKTTHEVAIKDGANWQIDYLHIDADHSFEGALQDFRDYLPLMAKNGIITFHDTNGDLPCAKVLEICRNEGFDVINFEYLCSGVALILPARTTR